MRGKSVANFWLVDDSSASQECFYPGAMTGIWPNPAESVLTEILQTNACPLRTELIENLPAHDRFDIVQV